MVLVPKFNGLLRNLAPNLCLLLQVVLPKPVAMEEAYNALAGTGLAGEVFQSDKSDRDTIILLGEQTYEFRLYFRVLVLVLPYRVGVGVGGGVVGGVLRT